MHPCRFPELLKSGACLVLDQGGNRLPACRATLRERAGGFERRFVSVVLSRPEHYFSLYQSGCNLSCAKCHSAEFSQAAVGGWLGSDELARLAEAYARKVNLEEPAGRWTMYHAEDLCRGCGACLLRGERSPLCPGVLEPGEVLLSPQGLGPARNLVAFTGGEITCRADYYAAAARAIRGRAPSLHVLVETNGAALDREALETMKQGGVEAFWLDIKAFEPDVHRRLTGWDNRHSLAAPSLMHELGFCFEVLSLYIPGLVETDQLVRIAELVAEVDGDIPFTLLAFFPAHQMSDRRSPTFEEMMETARALRRTGLRRLRLGNTGIFCRTEEQLREAASFGRVSVPEE